MNKKQITTLVLVGAVTTILSRKKISAFGRKTMERIVGRIMEEMIPS
jgi:hypothetical protein